MTRHPLHPDPEAAAAVRARLHLDANNMPLSLSPEERSAAQHPGEPESPMPVVPSFVPAGLKALATVIAGIGGVVLLALPSLPLALPAWVGFAVFAVTCIAAFLSGLAQPSGFAGRPLVPLTLVPAIASIAAALGHFAAGLPDGTVKSALLLVVALLLGAAGAVTPAPGQPVPAAAK